MINIKKLVLLIGLLPFLITLQSCGVRTQALANMPLLAQSKMQYNQDKSQQYEASDDSLNQEDYARLNENPFLKTLSNPLSTFSIDVDTASYSNARRMILQGKLPNKNAVRLEEFINYFQYDYSEPTDNAPFSVTTELSASPWNKANKLLQVGLKSTRIEKHDLPASNLVFLIDVSGSMHGRLPLVKSALKLLVEQLNANDRVSIVVYAGAAGAVLDSVSGSEKSKINNALDSLTAGGSTAGGAGIELAYKIAKKNSTPKSNNRVIILTDGDFNVGPASQAELHEIIEKKRKTGIYLTVLGLGSGNLKDATMEMLADKGNGNYAYIDSMLEAKKVLVNEIGATLTTIAKDVKIQVEFNPSIVKSYRLIGYENRMLRNEDFEDDTKDAGEIGAGHTVTALYEIVTKAKSDETTQAYKYSKTTINQDALQDLEVATIKVRFKQPESNQSQLLVHQVKNKPLALAQASNDFKFATAVAEFGLLLINSEYKGIASFDAAIERAKDSKGEDAEGYRDELIFMMNRAKKLSLPSEM